MTFGVRDNCCGAERDFGYCNENGIDEAMSKESKALLGVLGGEVETVLY
jgi:hypothetical protein